jgi:hypothetical protein
MGLAAMISRQLTEQDARVLAALHEVPDSDPIECVAFEANVTMFELRDSMFRLALRQPDPEA